jgi:hypothetical protein
LNYCLWDGGMPDESVMRDVMDFIENGMGVPRRVAPRDGGKTR